MKEATLDQLINALGWTLLHSLWQSSLIALFLYLVIVFSNKLSPNIKYILGVTALLFTGILSGTTFLDLYFHHQPELKNLQDEIYLGSGFSAAPFQITYERATASEAANQSWQFSSFVDQAKLYINSHLHWIVLGWVVGVLVFSLKFAGSLIYIERLKKRWVTPLAEDWQNKVHWMTKCLRLQQNVKVMVSHMAKVPMMLGHLKPIILIPASMLSRLPEDQLEAIIAHEIAHVYRKDYWINLLQSLFEIIFFFHPAIWWINNVIRYEREKCCDDLAIGICGSSLTYAKALASVEEAKLQHSSMALAINGGKSSLLHRIERILEPGKNDGNPMARFVSVSLIVAILLLLSASGESIAFRYGDKVLDTWEAVQFPNSLAKLDTSIQVDIDNDIDLEFDEEVEISEEDNLDKEIDLDLDIDISDINSDTLPNTKEGNLSTITILRQLSDSLSALHNLAIPNTPHPDSLHAYMFSLTDSNMVKSLQRLKQLNSTQQYHLPAPPSASGIYLFDVDSLIQIHGLSKAISPTVIRLDSVLNDMRLRTKTLKPANILQDTTLEKRLRELAASMREKEREFEKLMREKEEIIRELMEEKEVEQREQKRVMDEQMEEQLEQLKELMQKQEKLDEDQMREQEKQMKLQEEQLMKQMEEQEKLMRQQEEKMERQESRFDKANQALESELLEDGLIEPGERYSFKISNEGFFLNDKKQSDQLYQKYLDWLKDNDVFRYEEGSTLSINLVAE
ncbi:M56 family metallopeptidase [Catalinimonas sp. 4WD22]|uniref:M56 family metallopeptidase n=1 Tax=Catalinimonas locisalis TaxID=3133978 RepID=UPI00310184F4